MSFSINRTDNKIVKKTVSLTTNPTINTNVFEETYLIISATNSTITLPNNSNNNPNYYNNWYIKILSGNGINQIRQIQLYDSSTKILTLKTNFDIIPSSNDSIILYNKLNSNIIWQETNNRFIPVLTKNSTNLNQIGEIVEYLDFSCNNLNILSNKQSNSTSTGSLIVNGGVGISGSVNIGNNLNVTNSINCNSLLVNGISITGNLSNVYLTDLTPGTASASKALILDSNRDITNIRNLTATNLTGTLQTSSQPNITSIGTLTSLTLSGAISGITTINSSGIFTNTNSTNSTDNITGALVLSGGISINNTTDAISSINGGTFTTAGGMAIAKKLYIGTDLSVGGNSTLTGTLSVTGNITGTLATVSQPNITSVGTLTGLTSSGQVSITNNTSTTSSTTGALIVTGGISSNNNIYVGQTIKTGINNFSSSSIGTSGVYFQSSNAIITDSGTALNGTNNTAVFNSFARPTLAATNTGVTTTNAATIYIENEPLNGTNMTLSNSYALWVNSGKVLLGSGFGSTNKSLATLTINANTLNTGIESSAHGLLISGGNTVANTCLYMGADNTNSVSYIQSSKSGLNLPLVLNNRGGNVGIGLSNPSYTLDITGDLNISGNYRLSGSIINTSAITGVTAGTAAASKALILDSSSNISGINNLTLSGQNDVITITNNTTSTRTNLRFINDSKSWELGSRGSTASTPNSFYLYDNTAASYRLTINSSGSVNIPSHNGSTTGLQLNGTLVTATAAKLNYVDITTTGTAEASKALVLDSSSNISGINNLSLTGTLTVGTVGSGPNRINFKGTTGDSSDNFTVLAERIYSGTECSELIIFKGNDPISTAGPDRIRMRAAEFRFQTYTSSEDYSTLADTNNRLFIGNDGKVGINTTSPSYQLDISGDINLSGSLRFSGTAITATATELNYVDILTEGTAEASKALILDSNKDISNIRRISTTNIALNNSTNYYTPIDCGSTAADRILGLYNNSTSFYGFGAISSQLRLYSGATSGFAFYTSASNSSLGTQQMTISSTSTSILQTTSSTSSTTGALIVSGGIGCAGSINVASDINCSGALTVGTIGSGPNRINFSGTTGDANNNHTVLAERIYSGTQCSELIIFKGNDPSTDGPDRIRMRASEFRFQTYTSTEDYSGLADNNNRLFIGNDGKVGINTTSPGYQLEVNGEIRASNGRITMLSSGFGYSHFSGGSGNSELNTKSDGTNTGIGSYSNHDFQLYSNNSTRMTIKSSGNIGIGTTGPSYNLDISGICRATDRVIVGNNSNQLSNNTYPLFVNSWTTSTESVSTAERFYISSGGENYNNVQWGNCSAKFNDNIVATGFIGISDRRVKTNIAEIDQTFCKNFIMNCTPVSYNLKQDLDRGRNNTEFGYIAQELEQKGFLNLVTHLYNPENKYLKEEIEIINDKEYISPENTLLSISYNEIIPILAQNIKIIYDEKKILEDENNQLKDQLNNQNILINDILLRLQNLENK